MTVRETCICSSEVRKMCYQYNFSAQLCHNPLGFLTFSLPGAQMVWRVSGTWQCCTMQSAGLFMKVEVSKWHSLDPCFCFPHYTQEKAPAGSLSSWCRQQMQERNCVVSVLLVQTQKFVRVIANERGRRPLLRTYVLRSDLYYGDILKASLEGVKSQSFVHVDWALFQAALPKH